MDRMSLFKAMVRCRQTRRAVAAERRRRRMPALDGCAGPGWEALEAAAGASLREGDAFAAGAEWPGPQTAARRVGGTCRLTEMVSAGLGATIGCAAESLVISFAGPIWGNAETAALATAVKRRSPLVILYAAPRQSGTHAQAAALAGGAVFESVDAGDVEACAHAVAGACNAARAGQGPTLIAFRPSSDPIIAYAMRLILLGSSGEALRSVVLQAARPG